MASSAVAAEGSLARPVAAIGSAVGDILGGRLTGLAIVNLVLAGVISLGGAIAAIHYLVPLIPHAAGWLGWLYSALRFVLSVGAFVLGLVDFAGGGDVYRRFAV